MHKHIIVFKESVLLVLTMFSCFFFVVRTLAILYFGAIILTLSSNVVKNSNAIAE